MGTQPEIIRLNVGESVERWYVTKKLGEGACGAVYLVKDQQENLYALKAEKIDEPLPLIRMEALVMMDMAKSRARHLAEMADKGQFRDFNYIVMKLVGKSLQDMKKTGPDQHLSLGCAISVGIQCLEALEDMHNCGYLHRDVKPGNFCVGRSEVGETRKIYILDFGMARKFTSADGTIRKPRENAMFRGTPRYAPIASHDKKEHARREDMESWFYMLVDFSNAKLPWKGVTEIGAIGEAKKAARKDPNTFFTGCPKEYQQILTMIDGLQYYEAPPYSKIYDILRKCIRSYRASEFPYDWEKLETQKTRSTMGAPTVVQGWQRARASRMDSK